MPDMKPKAMADINSETCQRSPHPNRASRNTHSGIPHDMPKSQTNKAPPTYQAKYVAVRQISVRLSSFVLKASSACDAALNSPVGVCHPTISRAS